MACYLDPDYRNKTKDPSKPYCARCQKNIKDISKAVKVSIDWNTWQVSEGGDELLGPDCWKQITKG